jgi:hypothetical protein
VRTIDDHRSAPSARRRAPEAGHRFTPGTASTYAIVAILLIGGPRAYPLLQICGAWLQRNWPTVLAGLLLVGGSGLTIADAAALLAQSAIDLTR